MLCVGKSSLLEDFYLWQYSVYFHRGYDCDYFYALFEYWQDAAFKVLYRSYAASLEQLFEGFKSKHQSLLQRCQKLPDVPVQKGMEEAVASLTLLLLNADSTGAHELIQKQRPFFDDIYSLIDALVVPSMKRVGYMWQVNEISVAKEHLATATMQKIFSQLSDLEQYQKDKTALVCAVGDELHLFGVQILENFLSSMGYNVINLGALNSDEAIATQVQTLRPSAVFLSVTLPSNVATLQKTCNRLKTQVGYKGRIVVGGQGVYPGKDVGIEGADFCASDLESVKKYLLQKVKEHQTNGALFKVLLTC